MNNRFRAQVSSGAGDQSTSHVPMVAGAPKLGWHSRGDEAGTVLVVALLFLSAVSIIVAALTGSAGNDLKNTVNFENDRSALYAAAGATQVAIWYTRYSATTVGTTACPGTTNGTITVSNQAVAVWCKTASASPVQSSPSNLVTRVVTLYACPASEPQALTGCASPLVQAQIYIDDYSNSTSSTPGVIECSQGDESTCGTGMSINSWVEN